MSDKTIPLPPGVDVDYNVLLERVLLISGADTVTRALYRGAEGLYAVGGDGWAWLGVDGGRLIVRGSGRLYTRVIKNIKKTFLDAYYYSGRAHIYFIYAGEESLQPRLRENPFKSIARRLLAENMVYMFFLAAAVSLVIYTLFGPLLAPIALAATAFIAITLSPFTLPQILSDWPLRPGENVRILDISIPGHVFKELYRLIDRRTLVEMKNIIWGYIASGPQATPELVEAVFTQLLGVPEVPGIRVRQKDIDVHGELRLVTERLGVPPPRSIYLYNVVIKNALSMGLRGASSIIVTSGLLASLDPGEVAAVLGHEESHLYRMDLLVFTAAASAEYAFRLYYFFIYNPALLLNTWFMLAYLLATGTLMFLLAKLLELRADVDVARIGLSAELAGALTKIGYPLLLEEKGVFARMLEWLAWKPHPPLRYRVACAERLSSRPPRRAWPTALSLLLRGLLSAA